MTDVTTMAASALQGLSAADSMSWPALWHRASLLPVRRPVTLGKLWQRALTTHSSTLPTPHLHSTAPDTYQFAGPTDDLEWLLVSARNLTGVNLAGTSATREHQIWEELAVSRFGSAASVRGRIGTNYALKNLAQGLKPPASGQHNPHYFDDISCVRAIAAGLLYPGDPASAAEACGEDLSVTHAYDGIWAGQAAAAVTSALAGGSTIWDATCAARESLPKDSWTAGTLEDFMALGASVATNVELCRVLERGLVDQIYTYGTSAPETLALALTHLTKAASPEAFMFGVSGHARQADALMPLAGAWAAMVFGTGWLGPSEDYVVQGTNVSALAGTTLKDVEALLTRR